MAPMKALAEVHVAASVFCSELLDIKQSRGDLFAPLLHDRGKAETCAFSTVSNCSCGLQNAVDYTDQIVRDLLIAGVYDSDIRREAMGLDGITSKLINEVIHLIEKKEMTRDANIVSFSTFGISSCTGE